MYKKMSVFVVMLLLAVPLLTACGTTEEATSTLVPTEMPPPTQAPTEAPEATDMPEPTEAPEPTDMPEPTEAPEPTDMPEPTETPEPTEPEPTDMPEATDMPALEPVVGLELAADGLVSPVGLIPVDDGSDRLFVVDQVGLIHILTPEGELLDQPFLDLRDRMVELTSDFDERGLLGLAFHPQYAENGRFFVYYSAPLQEGAPSDWNHTSHVSEFAVSDDPNLADPASERILLQVDQPQFNHDAGQIAFGPDGYLYVPLGDGGGANDTDLGHTENLGNAQDVSKLLGSILRLDVDDGDPYGIPDDNPFADSDAGQPEIYAWGLRNPFRITFDVGGEHELFVGDAGQNLWEEVSIVELGNNYGWHIKEGTHCFDPENPDVSPDECPDTGPNGEPLVDPIIEYQNANAEEGIGLVVIGGYVYRGSALPAFQGRYLFGDWSVSFGQGDGKLFVASRPEQDGQLWSMQELEIANMEGGQLGAYLLSFGQDLQGEMYVLTTDTPGPTGETGKVYRIVPPGGAEAPMPEPMVSITVMDQALEGNAVTVDTVVSDGPGWIVIHQDQDGAPGPVIGHAAVSDGENSDVSVEIDLSQLTSQLYAMLHTDSGEQGTYEFPDGDPPVMVGDQVVVQPFQLEVASGEVAIDMIDFTFDPERLIVQVGSTVTWTNRDDVDHTTTSDDGVWDSGLIGADESFSYTFDRAGVYPYYCQPHGGPGGEGMAGTLIVIP